MFGMTMQQQFSHTQMERPPVVPPYLSVGRVSEGIPGHPLNDLITGRLSDDITRMVTTVCAQNAHKNHLRVYMWNQISSGDFINPYLKRLVAMTTDCVLLRTASFGNNGGSSDQLVHAIQVCASQCCEIMAAINAVEQNPVLLSGVNQNDIMRLYQLGTQLREQVATLKQRMTVSRTISPAGLDFNSSLTDGNWGSLNTGNNLAAIARDISGHAMTGGDAVDALSFGNDSSTPEMFSGGVSHVTDFDNNFGVLESMDAMITEGSNMQQDIKNVVSDHLPLPPADQKPAAAEPVVVFRNENGHDLSLISTDPEIVRKLITHYVPGPNRQFIADVYHPSFQKIGVFFNPNDKTHTLSVFGEKQVEREAHYKAGAPGLDIGIVVPDELFVAAFARVEENAHDGDESVEKLESVIPDGVNIVQSDSYRAADNLEAALKYAGLDALTSNGVFATKQHFMINETLYMLPEFRAIIHQAISDASNGGIGDLINVFKAAVDILLHASKAATGIDKARQIATFESLNVLETQLTQSVNDALHFNLGIPAEQLSITSVLDDWSELVGLLTKEFHPVFVETLIKSEAEIISRSIAILRDDDIDVVADSRFVTSAAIRANNIVTAVPVRVTSVSVTTEQLDIAVLPGIGMTIQSDDENLKTFISNVYNDEVNQGGRAFLTTQNGDVFEVHRPWLAPAEIASYVISKVK